MGVINIEKYYCHYNDKDDKYYVDESYPQKKKKKSHDGCKVYVEVNCCCDHKKDDHKKDDHKKDDHKKKDCSCHKKHHHKKKDCGCHKKYYYEEESDY